MIQNLRQTIFLVGQISVGRPCQTAATEFLPHCVGEVPIVGQF